MAVRVRAPWLCEQSLVRTERAHLMNEREEGSGMMLDDLTTSDKAEAQGRHAARRPAALYTAPEWASKRVVLCRAPRVSESNFHQPVPRTL